MKRTAFLLLSLFTYPLFVCAAGIPNTPSTSGPKFLTDPNGRRSVAMMPHLDMAAEVHPEGLVVRGPLGKPEWETRFGLTGTQAFAGANTAWTRYEDASRPEMLSWSLGHLRVEYVLGAEGIRQNFIIAEPLDCDEPLSISLSLSTPLCPELEGTTGIAFRGPEGSLRHAYRDLKVWDACGNVLGAAISLTPSGDGLTITVDDEGAVYPVTIDPVSTTHDRQLAPSLGGNFGWSVATAGDLNGDGYSDVAVGAWSASSGQSGEGLVYVYYGSSNGIPAAPSVILQEDQADANFGWSVDGAGDVNGDGYSDLLVGATTWENDVATDKEGATFVYHGSAAGINPVPAVILQSNATNQYMGYSVAGLGDINGDGYSDVGTGGHLAARGQTNEGVAWIFLGSATGVNPIPRHILERNQGAAQFGGSISGAGDVNGDGFNDVIIGAHKYELAPCSAVPANTCDDGAIFIYHGSANALGIGVNPAPTLTFNTLPFGGKQAGWAVSTAGDVNGDGYSDVIIGDWRDDVGGPLGEGTAFVFHGSATGVVTSAPAAILQSNTAYTNFGRSVSTAGDVNGDGYADVVVGSTLFSNGQSLEGAMFLYLGSATGISSSAFLRYEGQANNYQMGESVSTAGDVNGDGYSDMIAGINNAGGGLARIYHGGTYSVSNTPSFNRASGSASARLGWSVANAGDINGDGYSDAVMGAPNASNGQANEGVVYVHYGSATGLSAARTSRWRPISQVPHSAKAWRAQGDVNGDGYADVYRRCPVFRRYGTSVHL
ncbi:MAG: FG-GAP-like repeat-containing protein [Flavobacteriales bacterium]